MNKKLKSTIYSNVVYWTDIFKMSTTGLILSLAVLSATAVSVQKNTVSVQKNTESSPVIGAMNAYISKRFKKCNSDSYSTHVDVYGETYFHLKNLYWSSQSQPLSQADRLNGVQWKGIVYIKADVYRRTLETHRTQWGGWSDNFNDTGSAVQQNGKWTISFSGSTFYFSPGSLRECSFYTSLKSTQ